VPNPETNLQDLLRRVVEMHPGEARIIEIDSEIEKSAWQAWRESAKRIAPKLEQLRHDRAMGYANARNVIIG